MKTPAIVAIIIAAILLTGGLTYWITGARTQSVVEEETQNQVTGAITSVCGAANPKVDFSWRILNDEASGAAEYLYATLFLEEVDASGNILAMSTVSGGNVSTRTTSTDALKCGKPYHIDTMTTQDGSVVALKSPIELTGDETATDPVIKDIHSSKFSTVSMRVFDVIDDQYVDTNNSASNDTKAYIAPSATAWFGGLDDAQKTVGLGDNFIQRYEVKTASVDSRFGGEAVMCIDNSDKTSPNDWSTPLVTMDGKTLEDVRGTMSANDVLALSGYSFCYKVGTITKNPKLITVDMPPASGVNPSYDITVRFVALGTYESIKVPGTLLHNVGFRDDSGRTEIATAVPQVFKWNIA